VQGCDKINLVKTMGVAFFHQGKNYGNCSGMSTHHIRNIKDIKQTEILWFSRVKQRKLGTCESVDTPKVEPQCIVAPVEPLYKTVPIDAGDMKICSFPVTAQAGAFIHFSRTVGAKGDPDNAFCNTSKTLCPFLRAVEM
jgi:hypothetical protein